MLHNNTFRRRLRRWLVTALVGAVAFTMIIPFLWMLSASFKTPQDVMKLPIQWLPGYFYPNNYQIVWNIGDLAPRDYHFAHSYWNSVVVTFFTVVSSLITSSMAGYAFAKIDFKGRDAIFLLYLATMMVPSAVTLIPKFIIFEKIGFIGTLLPIIVPRLVTVTGTFFMKQYYLQVPNEIKESAVIDGAGELTIWARIMVPMAGTQFASLGVLAFLWNWNNYDEALVFLTKWQNYTIPIALNNFIEETLTQYNLIMAASVSALVPVFVLFILGQNFFIHGITDGAVKG